MAEAIEMVRDAIGLWGITELDHGRKIPEPAIIEIENINANEITTLVDVDFLAYCGPMKCELNEKM